MPAMPVAGSFRSDHRPSLLPSLLASCLQYPSITISSSVNSVPLSLSNSRSIHPSPPQSGNVSRGNGRWDGAAVDGPRSHLAGHIRPRPVEESIVSGGIHEIRIWHGTRESPSLCERTWACGLLERNDLIAQGINLEESSAHYEAKEEMDRVSKVVVICTHVEAPGVQRSGFPKRCIKR